MLSHGEDDPVVGKVGTSAAAGGADVALAASDVVPSPVALSAKALASLAAAAVVLRPEHACGWRCTVDPLKTVVHLLAGR